jgi:hypothetical protein
VRLETSSYCSTRLLSRSKSEQSNAYERQQSKEDTLWQVNNCCGVEISALNKFQNELKEVIWLELKAWFAGNDVNVQDQWILQQRKLVDQVLHMVGNYR